MKPEQLKMIEFNHSAFSEAFKGRLEALLFASGEPIDVNSLSAALQTERDLIEGALEALQKDYEAENRGICLNRMEQYWQLTTKPMYFDDISALFGLNQPGVLSKAAVETLAIVAYQQPVTRVEVEGLRGVSSSSSLQVLLDRGLIQEAGRLDAPGRPFLYKTTEKFLASVGIEHLSELPDFEFFKAMVDQETLDLV